MLKEDQPPNADEHVMPLHLTSRIPLDFRMSKNRAPCAHEATRSMMVGLKEFMYSSASKVS